MGALSTDKAKEIILRTSDEYDMGDGRSQSLLNFTLLIKAAEVCTIQEIDAIGKNSHDLVHLSGIHKFRQQYSKAEEIRWFWTQMWRRDCLINEIDGLRSYIVDVCEASTYRAGKGRRSYGLFLDSSGYGRRENLPWRTDAWYEARKPKKVIPLTEFYPYISTQPTEEHEFLLAVDSLVPKGIPREHRGDICQDMLLAILSGETTLENLRDAVPRYVKWFLKQAPSKYGNLSLDSPLMRGEYAGKTLGETIAAEYA